MINLNEWLTIEEAAKKLGITKQAVRKASKPTANRAAAIRTYKVGRGSLFNKSDVLAYTVRPKYRKEETK